MLVDGRTLSQGTVVEAEVAIAGAGPAGITMARELAGRGISVALIEGGGRSYDRDEEFPLTTGESEGLPYYPLSTTRARVFGGSSHLWGHYGGWRVRPFDAIDFTPHCANGLSGWPFGRETLDPYYVRAMEMLELDDFDGVHGWPKTTTAPPLDDDGEMFTAAELRFADPDCFTRRLGELRRDDSLQLVLHANVVDVRLTSRDRVGELVCSSTPGSTFAVRARHFVLALGGIENARLLLAARGGRGVGNEYDQVGRYFMEHPRVTVGVVRPADAKQWEALAEYRQRYPNPPPGSDYRIVVADDVRREADLLGTAFMMTPVASVSLARGARAVREYRRGRRVEPPQRLKREQVRDAVSDPFSVARFTGYKLRKKEPECDALELAVISEQEPDSESRLVLADDCDPFGVPRVRLHWSLSDNDYRAIGRSTEMVAARLREIGVRSVETLIDQYGRGMGVDGHYHHMGTTRMSPDPEQGVINDDLRVHSQENLFVTGVSAFPTGGWANPTLTLLALSMRLADHLAGLAGARTTERHTVST